MKYLYLLIGIIFIGCNSRILTIDTTKAKESKNVGEKSKPIVKEQPIIFEEEVVVEEPKVTKDIQHDVPKKCTMWSDGCNVCNRLNTKKASCTTYPACHNRLVSCLKWN